MPVNSKLMFDSLVFILVNNSDQVLNQAIDFFSENFFAQLDVYYLKSNEKNVRLEHKGCIVVCEYTGNNKLCFSRQLSNIIIYKILQANEKHLHSKNLLIKEALNLPYNLGKLTRLDLKLILHEAPENHFSTHSNFIVNEIQEIFESNKKPPQT